MKRNYPACRRALHDILFLVVGILGILSLNSCGKNLQSQNSIINNIPLDTSRKWVDWNVLFESNSTQADRQRILADMKNSIIQYVMDWNTRNGMFASTNIQYWACPCDTLLYNFSATTPVGAAGLAASPPPKPGNKTPATGDAVKFINQNNSFLKDELLDNLDKKYAGKVDSNRKFKLINSTIDDSKILAVMDTGLDSSLFVNNFHGLLWNAPQGEITYRNFQYFNNFRPFDYCFDDDSNKHGSAVTAIALQALEGFPLPKIKPRVMVLKVLDQNRVGTTFTVSCALSYAVQKHATLVNASLGYYHTPGMEIDSVLRNYIGLCDSASPSLPVIAAAGNLLVPHLLGLCTTITSKANELNMNNRFFPGCFSVDFPNVICVTGLQTTKMPCFYQNGSDRYVNIGVVTNPETHPLTPSKCCIFPVSFYPPGYTGSSFATPVVSGKIMAALLTVPGISWQMAKNNIGALPTTKAALTSITYLSPL
jgi:hypothetical protein